jgi:hypothetical protein
MMRLPGKYPIALLAVLGAFALPAFAQTDTGILYDTTWRKDIWGQTIDKAFVENKGNVQGGGKEQTFFWDSTGVFRFGKENPNAPVIGYRSFSVDFNHESPAVPKQLVKIALVGGLHLGEVCDGNLSVIAGAGYEGDKPFANPGGSIFEVAHLVWQKPIDEENFWILSADYDSGGSFLPDIPLPGFAYAHREDCVGITVGFPRDTIRWKLTDRLTFLGNYNVPYSADAYLDYKLNENWSVFANAASFYEAFVRNRQDNSNRFFEQMKRVEIGIHYYKHDFWHGQELDVAGILGYAFDQDFDGGFDVRDTHHISRFSDEPYLGLILRGAM